MSYYYYFFLPKKKVLKNGLGYKLAELGQIDSQKK